MCVQECVYVCVQECVYGCVQVYVHVCVQECICVYRSVCMGAYICVCMNMGARGQPMGSWFFYHVSSRDYLGLSANWWPASIPAELSPWPVVAFYHFQFSC